MSLRLCLKSFIEAEFRTTFGKDFRGLSAYYEKDLSNIDISDLGTSNAPFPYNKFWEEDFIQLNRYQNTPSDS